MSSTTEAAQQLLEEIRRLMELKGENPFKVRAFDKASASLAGLGDKADLVARAEAGTLTEIAGIGKGISELLTEFLIHGKSTMKDELTRSLPAGLMELAEVPGVGPKKALRIIEALGIQTVSELEYACRENRLLKLPGFGEKLQQKVLDGIQFMNANRGLQRIDEAFPVAEKIAAALTRAVHAAAAGARVSEAGALRRRLETLDGFDFVVEERAPGVGRALDAAVAELKAAHPRWLPIRTRLAAPARFGYELARATGTDEHWKALGSPKPFDAATEDAFFDQLGLPPVAPEMRETGEEVALARAGKLAAVLPWNGIRGVFHNHTTRSDGSASLEEMVVAAKRLGYAYLGVSDHSQSAFYAQGLKNDTLLEQEREIRDVQDRHPEIRVFWGIESDILADGSLDYEPSVLKRFDFVIASVHSRFKMDRETMTLRIIEAIRNPATRFLGHATGRLLLGRHGYDVDMERVIAAAAEHDVAIEINANPARLDIDWRWGPQLRKSRTLVSVNPDAHETAGLEDTLYGIAVARKALLPTELVVNARGADEVAKWLAR